MGRKSYDCIVIGAGPGGYVAAIQASLFGQKVALIEKDAVGGTCLNKGCIPTKTLIAQASVLTTLEKAKEFGYTIGKVQFEYAKMKERKDRVVGSIRQNLASLIRSHDVDLIEGRGEFLSPSTVKVHGKEPLELTANSIIIATGSETLQIGAFPVDGILIHDSTTILEMTSLPTSIVIVGGGYIGCEFASLFHRLGVKVHIVEALDTILQAQGKAISEPMRQIFEKRGITLHLGTQVTSIQKTDSKVSVQLSSSKNLEASCALIAIGRRLYTDDLHVERAGLALTNRGGITVNDRMETAVKGIYAIGDVTGKSMLAHASSYQGIVAAHAIAKKPIHMYYHAIPAVIFTDPEVALVGYSIDDAKTAGYDAEVAQFPFAALGKAQASLSTEGFAQIVFEKKTGLILGAQMVGEDASNMIGEMAVAIQNELTIESIAETIHAHPTLGESWMEAAHIAMGMPIHLPPKKRRTP